MTAITEKNFPEAFAAMDKEAKSFWAYPDEEWQNNFLEQWAQEHGDRDLTNSLQEQASSPAPTQREIIMVATHYTFESDGSVALSGPLGSMWVFEDGSVHPVGTLDSSHGYPGYSDPAHLRVAKSDALGHLGLVTIVEKFGRQAEHIREKVENGTDFPDYRDVFYFPKEDETYNEGYRSGGTWVDSWWS